MAKNVLFSIIWILLLIFIAWPVAGFCAAIWIFLQVSDALGDSLLIVNDSSPSFVLTLICIVQPFEALFGFIKQINTFLEKLITWPRECGNGKSTLSPRVDVLLEPLSFSRRMLALFLFFSYHELPHVVPQPHVKVICLYMPLLWSPSKLIMFTLELFT
jgi:hypothetical protein